MQWMRTLRWYRHLISAKDQEMRLDRWLKQQFPSLPQSFIQMQLRKRKIRLQLPQQTIGKAQSTEWELAKANSILQEGCTVAIDAFVFQNKLETLTHDDNGKDGNTVSPVVSKSMEEQLLSRIMYKDENYFIIDKPSGLAIQEGTALEDSLVRYLPSFAAILGGDTPRLVHRLDKGTSGLLVLARHRLAAAKFSSFLAEGKVQKTYQALVHTTASRSFCSVNEEITTPIDGKPARTLVRRLKNNVDPPGIWLELRPLTGRKHQLRIHCADVLKTPIVGDIKYKGPRADRLYLHACHLRFSDPFSKEGRVVEVKCPIDQHPLLIQT